MVASKEATKKEPEEDEDEPDSGPPGDMDEAPPGLEALPPGTGLEGPQVQCDCVDI